MDVQRYAEEAGESLRFVHWALFYQTEYGLSIIPGREGSKQPFLTGVGHSHHVRACDGGLMSREEIVRFWGWEPFANILMFPGSISGVDVIDVDTKPGEKSGFQTLSELGLSWVIDEGPKVFSPTGNGIHVYFKHTVDGERNRKPSGSGLEAFWAGDQYLLMPPSVWENPKTGEVGEYKCNDSFTLDELKPVPEELVQYFLVNGKASPKQRVGHTPPGKLFGSDRSNPPPLQLLYQPPVKTLRRLGSESKRQWRQDNSLKHLAKNTDFPAKLKAFRSKVRSIQGQDEPPHILQRAMDGVAHEAHKALANLFKYRQWFLLLNDDGTEDGWIFKLHGRWHWVGMPGTNHDGVEIKPTSQELASIQGKGNGQYIVCEDGSTIVQFKHHSQSGRTSKVGWYTVYDEYQILEMDEFI